MGLMLENIRDSAMMGQNSNNNNNNIYLVNVKYIMNSYNQKLQHS